MTKMYLMVVWFKDAEENDEPFETNNYVPRVTSSISEAKEWGEQLQKNIEDQGDHDDMEARILTIEDMFRFDVPPTSQKTWIQADDAS